jgi:hypothetical protein
MTANHGSLLANYLLTINQNWNANVTINSLSGNGPQVHSIWWFVFPRFNFYYKTKAFIVGFGKTLQKFPTNKTLSCSHLTKKYNYKKIVHVFSMFVLYKNLYLLFWSFILVFFCCCREWIINILTKIFFEIAHGWWKIFFFLYSRFNYYNGSYKSSIECSACYMGSTKCCGFYSSSKKCRDNMDQCSISISYRYLWRKYWKYNRKAFKEAIGKEFTKQLDMHFSNMQQSWKHMQDKWNKIKENYEFERD